jgi:ribonucleoside-diphosphate reductase alpha chain
VWGIGDSDENILFPIEVPDGSKLKNQLPALKMLEIVKSTQQNWIMPGRTKSLCTQPWLSHNVSNTVIVRDDEWDVVADYIYKHRKYFTGVSLIPVSGDKDYPQAPFVEVLTSRDITNRYGDAAIWCSGLIELALQAFDGDLWKACDFVLSNDAICTGATVAHARGKNGSTYNAFDLSKTYRQAANRMEFAGRVIKFADKYLEGDVKKLTYCMKDVYNWKLYYDIRRDFVEVDYTKMIELEDNTQPLNEVSCAGGACLI